MHAKCYIHLNWPYFSSVPLPLPPLPVTISIIILSQSSMMIIRDRESIKELRRKNNIINIA